MISAPHTSGDAATSITADSVSEAVVTAVADAKGISPLELSPPLYDVIDPDALEAVVSSMESPPERPSGRLEFAYGGHEVTVAEDGRVSVSSIDDGGP